MVGINIEMMPFKKYVQAHLNKLYHEETVRIYGTYKDVSTNEIHDADEFDAHLIGQGTIEESYKAYLQWFNHTRTEYEHEREFISVKKIT